MFYHELNEVRTNPDVHDANAGQVLACYDDLFVGRLETFLLKKQNFMQYEIFQQYLKFSKCISAN